jgi:hydrogenase maturation protein HypF
MDAIVPAVDPPVRRRIAVRGIVQGVGFRPFVFRLASELALDGFVRNDAAGVAAGAPPSPATTSSMAITSNA